MFFFRDFLFGVVLLSLIRFIVSLYGNTSGMGFTIAMLVYWRLIIPANLVKFFLLFFYSRLK